jgi:hypothetical protein
MHTPTHAIVNLSLLDRRGAGRFGAIVAGAVLPDAPNWIFYLIYRGFLGVQEAVIWADQYQRPFWQAVMAPTHSIPIAVVVLAVAAWRRSPTAIAFATSWLMHIALDLPVHNIDAHRHLWPITDARFISPLSYWDRAHHASLIAPLEILLLAIGSTRVWRRRPQRWLRVALILVNGAMLAAWLSGRLFWSS